MQIHHPQKSPESPVTFWEGPWPWLVGGVAGCLLAQLWLFVLEDWETPGRVLLLFVSLAAAGIGVVRRPHSAAVLAAAAGAGLAGGRAMGPAAWIHLSLLDWADGSNIPWDSARLMLFVLSAVAALAAVLVLLPRVVRRAVVSFVIVFHFTGMLSAVFSVPPAPWLATKLWGHVFRPYLDFVYLNNAYHFYSPDPGPPNLLWLRLEYEDKSLRWYKMPNKEEYPTMINYQRRLSLTESVHQPALSADSLAFRFQRRAQLEQKWPGHPGVPQAAQFREPNKYSKRMIENMVRYVARNDPLNVEGHKLVKVRLYRVVHDIVEAPQLAAGVEPLDRWMYRPYYQGEYDPETGELLTPFDPLLYWLIPIVRKDERTGWTPPSSESLITVTAGDRTYEVYDFLRLHAGDYQ